MKYILAFFLTIPFFCQAQDCKIKSEKDPFSQQPKISSGFINIASGSVKLNIEADSKEIKFLFSMNDGSCFDDQSSAAISFDGSRTKSNQKNATSMNCEGIFSFVFKNSSTTPYQMQKMTAQKITSIVITGNGKQKKEILLKEEEKQMLMEKISCLATEAKKLVTAAP